MTQLGELAVSDYAITQKIYDILEAHKEPLGLEDVWYGPQTLMPNFPCVTVERRPKARAFNGTRRWDLTFSVGITLFHGRVQEAQLTRQENEGHAYQLEKFMMKDDAMLTLDGMVIFGFITSVEPGLLAQREVMYAATRLIWTGSSREVF